MALRGKVSKSEQIYLLNLAQTIFLWHSTILRPVISLSIADTGDAWGWSWEALSGRYSLSALFLERQVISETSFWFPPPRHMLTAMKKLLWNCSPYSCISGGEGVHRDRVAEGVSQGCCDPIWHFVGVTMLCPSVSCPPLLAQAPLIGTGAVLWSPLNGVLTPLACQFQFFIKIGSNVLRP